MKTLLLATITLISFNVFAATNGFDVKAEISLNGKLISKPHLTSKPNEMSSIHQKGEGNSETIIEMIASDYTSKDIKDGIKMNFVVSKSENGKQTVISKPQIVARPGETAEINVGEKTNSLQIKVIASRI